MPDIDTALVQQVFDIALLKRESDIQHPGQTDDLGRRYEIAKGAAFCYLVRL